MYSILQFIDYLPHIYEVGVNIHNFKMRKLEVRKVT